MAGNLFEIVAFIGVDSQELNLLASIALLQLDQRRGIEIGHRAIGAKEYQHDGLVPLEAVKRPAIAAHIAERIAVGNLLADGPGFGGRGVAQRSRLRCLCTLGESPVQVNKAVMTNKQVRATHRVMVASPLLFAEAPRFCCSHQGPVEQWRRN